MQPLRKTLSVLHHPGLGSAAAGWANGNVCLVLSDVLLCSAPSGAEVAPVGAAEMGGHLPPGAQSAGLRERTGVSGKANKLGERHNK